jgi:hypothetical protein
MEPGSHPRRPTVVRRRFLALLLLLAGLTLLPAGGPASASCAGPSVEVPRTLTLGATTEVRGEHFVVGCRDTMSCPAFGCGECEYDEPPPKPSEDVVLQLRQDGARLDLAYADADERGRVRWSFVLPEGVRPGRAELLWDGDPRGVPVRVLPTAG